MATVKLPSVSDMSFRDPSEEFPDQVAEANMLTVHNILASAALVCPVRLDLDKSCQVLGNSYHNPTEFPALRVDVRGKSKSLYTISLFESGRIQSAGGCRPAEAKRAMMKIGKRLNQKFDYGLKLENFEIQNILAVYDACFPVNLGQFASIFTGSVDYEPDRFPAARVRVPIPSRKSNANQPVLDEAELAEQRASMKLRKLMMGDATKEDSPQTSASKGVGSYIINSTAKRSASTRQKDEAKVKEEVVTANVFSTGKITFTGAKSIASLNYALDLLRPFLGPPIVPQSLNSFTVPYGQCSSVAGPHGYVQLCPSGMSAAPMSQLLYDGHAQSNLVPLHASEYQLVNQRRASVWDPSYGYQQHPSLMQLPTPGLQAHQVQQYSTLRTPL